MSIRQEIDNTALIEVTALESEFFDIVKDDSGQHRVLKVGKTIEDFNSRHAVIWQLHDSELIKAGIMQPQIEPLPVRDLAAEIDELKIRISKLEVI